MIAMIACNEYGIAPSDTGTWLSFVLAFECEKAMHARPDMLIAVVTWAVS